MTRPHDKGVIIADRADLLRQGLATALAGKGYRVAGMASTCVGALQLVAESPQSMLIIEHSLVSCMDGGFFKALAAASHSGGTILLDETWTAEGVVKGLAEGARGFVTRACTTEQLAAAAHLVEHGGLAVCETAAGVNLRGGLGEVSELLQQRQDRLAHLCAREIEILRLLPTSLTLGEIAERLFLSRKTVQNSTSSLYRKLEVSGRAEAVALAVRLSLATSPSAAARLRTA